jgi:hypothetical protein
MNTCFSMAFEISSKNVRFQLIIASCGSTVGENKREIVEFSDEKASYRVKIGRILQQINTR